MLKKILIILCLLTACTTTVKLDEKVTIAYFYVQTCSDCKAFKSEAIPYLERRYDDSIEIKQYDLDDSKNTKTYDSYINKLKDFDEEFYGNGPFIVVEGYFAILGYNSGDEEYLASDIENAIDGHSLSEELEGVRFEYK